MSLVPTTSFLDALLMIRNGDITARWNFPAAAGSWEENPGGIGTAVAVTYNFPEFKPAHAWESGFLPFSNTQKAAARAVMKAFSEVANIQLVESPLPYAQILLMNGAIDPTASAYAYQPNFGYSTVEYPEGNYIFGISTGWVERQGGDVWMNSSVVWEARHYLPDAQARYVIAHEVAHALGLKHAWEGMTNNPGEGHVLAPRLSTHLRTLMGERTGFDNYTMKVGLEDGRLVVKQVGYVLPDGPMMEDIAALQYLYGANMQTRKGDTVYTWARNAEFIDCIWDGGGKDTIDCSKQVFTCLLDLRAGTFSSVGLRQTAAEKRIGMDLPSTWTTPLPDNLYDGRNNLSIARGAVIENATGGSAADRITGNAAANRLLGGAGDDTLAGGAGNDTLNGGSGTDSLTGGGGDDTYLVHQPGDRVVELAGGGVDLVVSQARSAALAAEVENGRIVAAGPSDLAGNGLANLILAGAGNNVISGGAGADTLSYQFAGGGVSVSLAMAAAQATGGSGTDRISGFEHLSGSAHADRLTGNGGQNTLDGAAGNDLLCGGGGRDDLLGGFGNDTLQGGMGSDRLTGGKGQDVFDFDAIAESGPAPAARDVLVDFQRGADRIDLSGIDAHAARAGNQAFTFVGTTFGVNATGQLRFEGGVLYGSTDADAAAEFAIRVTGTTTLSAADLVL